MRTEITPLVLSCEEADDILEDLVNNFFTEVPNDGDDFYTPSLYELYDIDVDVTDNDCDEQAVSAFFPESLLLATSEGLLLTEPPVISPVAASDGLLLTEPPILSPVCEPVGGEYMPRLQPEDMDLLCYETGFPVSDSEDEQDVRGMALVSASAMAAVTHHEKFELDNPELPGHDCKSCEYHRNSTGNNDLMCSLCYLRAYGMFIYSKCILKRGVG